MEEKRGRPEIYGGEDALNNVTRLFAKQNLHCVPSHLTLAISSKDRLDALHELHGVTGVVDETPGLVDSKITELDEELLRTDLYPIELQEAYRLAIQQGPYFMEKQKLVVLRGERFNISKAALRILKHFQMRRSLFGAASLGEDLGLKHLDDIELQALKEGPVQPLSRRDRSGRAIVVQFAKLATLFSLDTVIRLVFWCNTVVSSHDKEVQKRGLIFVWYAVGEVKQIGKYFEARSRKLMEACEAFPVRLIGIHMCYNEPKMHDAMYNSTRFLETNFICRYQSHFGSDLECRYNLMTFGIPVDIIPAVRYDGLIDLAPHHRWLAHYEIESSSKAHPHHDRLSINRSVIIAAPGRLDVIMGRGLRGRRFRGNQLLKRKIDERKAAYFATTSRLEKSRISKEIYDEIRNIGSAFLAPVANEKGHDNPSEWVEVSEEASRDRIGHLFRNVRQQSRASKSPTKRRMS